ncbi:hypothetical protein THMIRHAM_04070 [Thiomicrorhabdus immobilis]|uniref:GGDEF domain-containing protein n=1 Tax=Thiomicrorhabdus immobilis TaxID=2791037 RepID=A0ABN6CXN2_9GAMM|nr:sensor domain-containing diguanylate cyclase [Thiomicrorhabdus immobilis]BCN92622.1 hypothetical protein THMIRHAM_04070 [Thiomicrorhabdus immobilis]
MERIRSKSMFILIMLVVLTVLTVLLWQRYNSEVKQFSELQQTLMQQQAYQTAKDIKNQVNIYRNQMAAISLDPSWISNLSLFRDMTVLQKSMHDRLQLYFPNMYAFSIADDNGAQLGGDIELFVADVCQADISNLATMFNPQVPYFDYEPYIHPKDGAYHFDVMIPIFVQGKKLVFFMSFKANILTRILHEHIISEHRSFLVRKDIPDLIEVSDKHVRDELKRPFRLSESEVKRVAATAFVDNTRWKVVVVENSEIMNNFKYERFLDFIILFLILFMFWMAVAWLGLQHETRQGTLLSRLSHQSSHDALTGLVNRRQLAAEMASAIEDARALNTFSAILYMDLNGFKEINDEYGHDIGDALLVSFAHRLKYLARNHDVVARLGGDEFVVLLKNIGTTLEEVEKSVNDTLKRFEVKLDTHYRFKDLEQTINCQPSIGKAIIDNQDRTVEELLKIADYEMYEAKRSFHKYRENA